MAEPRIKSPTRRENTRDKRPGKTALCFTLSEVKSHFAQNIAAIRDQSAVADEMRARGDYTEAEFIWRTQIMYLSSALDYFMHELTNYGCVRMFTHNWARTPGYDKLKVEVTVIDEALASPGSSAWLVSYINDAFGHETLTNYPRIKDQADLLGIDINRIMKNAFPPPKSSGKRGNAVGYGAEILSEICTRRNRIAHQTDRDPKNARQNPISGEYVRRSINHVERLVQTLCHAAEEKDRA